MHLVTLKVGNGLARPEHWRHTCTLLWMTEVWSFRNHKGLQLSTALKLKEYPSTCAPIGGVSCSFLPNIFGPVWTASLQWVSCLLVGNIRFSRSGQSFGRDHGMFYSSNECERDVALPLAYDLFTQEEFLPAFRT